LKRRTFKHTEIRDKRTYTAMVWVPLLLCAGFLRPQVSKQRPTSFFMSIYQQNKAYYSQPYRLTAEQMNHPTLVFEKFFDCLHLHQAREAIADMLFVALTSPNEAFKRAHGAGRCDPPMRATGRSTGGRMAPPP